MAHCGSSKTKRIGAGLLQPPIWFSQSSQLQPGEKSYPEHTSRDSCWSNTSRSRAWVWNLIRFVSHLLPEVGIFPWLPVSFRPTTSVGFSVQFCWYIWSRHVSACLAFSTFALPTLPRQHQLHVPRDQQGSTHAWPWRSITCLRGLRGPAPMARSRRNAIRQNTPATIEKWQGIKSHLSELFGFIRHIDIKYSNHSANISHTIPQPLGLSKNQK